MRTPWAPIFGESAVTTASEAPRRRRAQRVSCFATWIVFFGANALSACRADSPVVPSLPPPPDVLYGALFVDVQTAELFEDQKTFVDAVPKQEPHRIVELYEQQRAEPGFELASFVSAHFTLPSREPITPPAGLSLREHIDWLWPALTRTTQEAPPGSSLIPLPERYVVPGGRFREVYYWDTYFTMLGLEASGRGDLVDSMLSNFTHQLDRFGHIPNGNRTYYLSRSQPPYFSHMVELSAQRGGDAVYVAHLPALRREHAFWMEGADAASPRAARRVVVLPDGSVLNRYWDDRDVPRPESYLQDVRTAQQAPEREPAQVYRDLRAAAESGWDFSSRWLGDGKTLATIRTTSIVPVDLNSLLHHLETSIAKACSLQGEPGCVDEFAGRAEQRARGIERYLWNERGHYADYDWEKGRIRDDLTAAALYPLYVGIASDERAQATARAVESTLLAPGGIPATTVDTGQQWDAPNGWAPLHWVAVEGLRRYGQTALAEQIGTRFLTDVTTLFAREGKLVEKYAVSGTDFGGGGGGEYPLQDGFGWTNGVTLMLLDLYPAGATATPAGASLTRPWPVLGALDAPATW